MAGKTIKTLLAEALEDLKQEDFKKFCSRLLDRREEPIVRRMRVDGKDFLEVTDVLVETFTEKGALQVTVDILTAIGCKNLANRLVEQAGGQSSGPGSSGTASAGAADENLTKDKHFVDEHRVELIRRVHNIGPILDELFDNGVLSEDIYDKIRDISPLQEQMRALYRGPLKAGDASKDKFYEILQKHETYLIDDLNSKK